MRPRRSQAAASSLACSTPTRTRTWSICRQPRRRRLEHSQRANAARSGGLLGQNFSTHSSNGVRATNETPRKPLVCSHFQYGANRDRTGDLLLAKRPLVPPISALNIADLQGIPVAGLGATIGADARGISTIIVDSGTSRDECLNELPVSGGGSQPSASSDDPTPVRRGVGAVRHHRQREHLVRRSRYRDRVRSARLRVSDIAKSTGDGDAETSCTSPGLSLIRPGWQPAFTTGVSESP
jgi:hypothetical protein